MANLLDPSWGLSTPDLLQQMALLAWLNKGDEGKEMLKLTSQMRIGYEFLSRVSGERDIQAAEQACILAIADFVKKNPKASQDKLQKEVEKQIEIFKQRVEDA